MLAILYSVTALVPINNRIKSNPPPDWKMYRRRWDLLHRWRVVLLTIAFAFLIVGFVSKETSLASSPRAPYKQGLSGLYHVAIHPPNARDFARLFKGFTDLRYPIYPTDHTFSKSSYLDDPDGINIEFTLETPERFKGVKPGVAPVNAELTRQARARFVPTDARALQARWDSVIVVRVLLMGFAVVSLAAALQHSSGRHDEASPVRESDVRSYT